MKGLLFTYALCYGGAVVSLFNPFIGLLIYICFAILKPESLWPWSVPAGNFSRIVALALLAGWVMNGFGQWNLGKARPIVLAFIGFWCWSVVSAMNAKVDSSTAFVQVEEFGKVLLPFLVGITTITSPRQVKQLAWVIVLCQGYLAYEFNLMYYQSSLFLPHEWKFGSYLDNNGIAITMVTSAGMAFFLGLDAAKWWQRWGCFALAALMVHVVLFSMSRGGMLAVIVTGVVSVILIPKRPKEVAIISLAVLVGISLAGPQVIERFKTAFAEEEERDASAEGRLNLWTTCTSIMLDHPMAGIGLQNWKLVAHDYGFTPGKDSHTMWLHIGAEMGLVGLGFLVSFYGYTVARLWPAARGNDTHPDVWTECAARMVVASLVGFAISAQFVSVQGMELPYYIVLVGAGTLKLMSSTMWEMTWSERVEPLQVPVDTAGAFAPNMQWSRR